MKTLVSILAIALAVAMFTTQPSTATQPHNTQRHVVIFGVVELWHNSEPLTYAVALCNSSEGALKINRGTTQADAMAMLYTAGYRLEIHTGSKFVFVK